MTLTTHIYLRGFWTRVTVTFAGQRITGVYRDHSTLNELDYVLPRYLREWQWLANGEAA